jgi:MSHA biogenesis protein MshM
MYRQHFGLRDAPFRLTPDTGFFYPGSTHQEALNVLLLGLADGEGFIKISGEVGLGKTMLCRALLAALDGRYCSAWIPNPEQSPASMRASVARELGIELPHNPGPERVLRLITERLLELAGENRPAVLVIDEAQALPAATLEAVRLLTNLETERRKLLQVVLFGQPELDQRLARPGLRQLQQRITFSHALQPLDADAVAAYVAHRLRAAGHPTGALFSTAALRLLVRHSRGVPRLINILAHKALLLAWSRGQAQVERAEIAAAAADTDAVPGVAGWRRWLARLPALVLPGVLLAGLPLPTDRTPPRTQPLAIPATAGVDDSRHASVGAAVFQRHRKSALQPLSPRERGWGEGSGTLAGCDVREPSDRLRAPLGPSSGASRHLLPGGEGQAPSALSSGVASAST